MRLLLTILMLIHHSPAAATLNSSPGSPQGPPPRPVPRPAPAPRPTPITSGTTTTGREFYVAPHPEGQPGNPGTIEQPLDIVSALSAQSPARPGDTIWLRGGTHRAPGAQLTGTEEPTLRSLLNGTADARIVVRQYPGERANIDGGLRVEGSWTDYRDFEISNSSPDRTQKRPMGLHVFGPSTRFINLIIHDNGNGIGLWQPAENAEVYGAIIYRNGWETTNDYRGHGHGVYTQNLNGTKSIVNVVSFDNYSSGMKAYAEAGYANNITFEGNISFNNGSPARPQPAYNRVENILVGTGANPVEGSRLIGNCTYHLPTSTGTSIFLGYTVASNRDIVLRDNYFAGGSGNHTYITRWQQVTMTGNTLVGGRDLLVLEMPAGLASNAYSEWDNNSYYSRTNLWPFIYTDSRITGGYRNLAEWKSLTGLDRNSNWLPGNGSQLSRLASLRVFIRPNRYEPGRANIAVYNWSLQESVIVDLSSLLKPGDRFEIRNAQDYFGPPVFSGIYTGQPIKLPMTGTATGPEFNAFVVLPITAGSRTQ